MRNYILTQNERQILQAFLKSNTRQNGYSVLFLRLKRNQKHIDEDVQIIKEVLLKVQNQ